jgi:hypothetical protein
MADGPSSHDPDRLKNQKYQWKARSDETTQNYNESWLRNNPYSPGRRAQLSLLTSTYREKQFPSKGVFNLRDTELNRKTKFMLMTIAIILLVLWALGLVSGTTIGGFIHVLLVIAVVVVLVRIIQGRRIL